MWADDIMWFPLLLQKKKFVGYFKFQGHEVILSHTLEEVDEIWDDNMAGGDTVNESDQKWSAVDIKHWRFPTVECSFSYYTGQKPHHTTDAAVRCVSLKMSQNPCYVPQLKHYSTNGY